MSQSYYAEASVELRRELAQTLPQDLVRDLHRPTAWKHFLVLAWQFLLLALGITGAWLLEPWYLWLPCSIVTGFTVFNFTVMLHEVVHDAVFRKKRNESAKTFLGWLYAFPSGISRSQFTRWHLDHHAQLGDWEADPKRHHLSPKRNARWYKLLYMTPALMVIYFRGAARETKTYEPELRTLIARERLITILGQLAILAALIAFAGWWIAFKVYIVPYFFVFPVAFTLNRLGQHYNIDPDDPAKWSTLMKPSWFWDIAFLWSNYHLEHHYFPRVPFYNLPKLHRALRPFYERREVVPTSYTSLLWNWFVLNKSPHSKWSDDASAEGAVVSKPASS